MDWKQFDHGVFLVNVAGIILDTKTKNILIGRRENDLHIPALTWCFPGGRPNYKGDIEENLQRVIKEKTGLKVQSLGSVFAKTYPEKREFLTIYYLCELVGGKEKAGGLFKELKWVKVTELEKYFTTSLHPKLKEYLLSI